MRAAVVVATNALPHVISHRHLREWNLLGRGKITAVAWITCGVTRSVALTLTHIAAQVHLLLEWRARAVEILLAAIVVLERIPVILLDSDGANTDTVSLHVGVQRLIHDRAITAA